MLFSGRAAFHRTPRVLSAAAVAAVRPRRWSRDRIPYPPRRASAPLNVSMYDGSSSSMIHGSQCRRRRADLNYRIRRNPLGTRLYLECSSFARWRCSAADSRVVSNDDDFPRPSPCPASIANCVLTGGPIGFLMGLLLMTHARQECKRMRMRMIKKPETIKG